MVFDISDGWFQERPSPKTCFDIDNINYGVWDHLVFDTKQGQSGGGHPVVPEPGAIVLMGIGAACIGWLQKRKIL